MSLSGRDEAILLVLARKVRCLDATLAAKTWWSDLPDSKSLARKRLLALARAGWLGTASLFAHSLPSLRSPLVVWKPGKEQPDFGPIAYHLQNRFSQPAKAQTIYWASRKTMTRLASGKVRRPRAAEVSHDLGLAAVYLNIQLENPRRVVGWISEAQILKRGTASGVKVPDALIAEEDGSATAIEFGGEYSKAKLLAFHQYCVSHQQRYELW